MHNSLLSSDTSGLCPGVVHYLVMRLNNTLKAPQAFCFNKSKVKAFILGADPINFSIDKKRFELY